MSVTVPAVDSEATGAERLAGAPPAVVADRLRKTFRIPHHQYSTLKERVMRPRRTRSYDELHAVDDISFTIAKGEFFGIVGRNGSGKSTLLKMLAGIYKPDLGEVQVAGRLSPFIELGVGFNPDLAARDNVTINAIMLGLSRSQARACFDDVIAFAELDGFVDLPLKNYSSGMSVRLGFSVAIEVDADVLLVDEVLAVGDAGFQQKCFAEFQRMKDAGHTIILVTHDMGAIQRFCDRALLIDHGRMLELGEPELIARAYNEINFGRLVHEELEEETETTRYGDHAGAEIVDCWFADDAGERIAAIAQREPLTVAIELRFQAAMRDPIFALTIRNDTRATIFSTSSAVFHGPTGEFAAGEVVVVRVRMDNFFGPSTYTVSPSVAHQGSGADAIDVREDIASIVVHSTHFTGGVVDVPHEYTVQRR
jgi:ABC-type polysaccharide/polyol phosphate transport system ATPase subunit